MTSNPSLNTDDPPAGAAPAEDRRQFVQIYENIMNENANARRAIAVATLGMAILMGCASTKPLDPDPKTGQFESFADVTDSEIKTYKPLAGIKDEKFVYVRTYSTLRTSQFDTTVRESLKKIGFPRIVSEEDLTKLVISSGLSGDVQNLTSVIALHQLSIVTGPFLVAEFRVVRLADTLFRLEVVIIDPVSGETVFAASRQKINWLNFDREFTYPLMNAVKRWFDDSAKLPVDKQPTKPKEGA
jgi:hypothetical protein